MKETLEKILDKFKILCNYKKMYCFENAVGYKVYRILHNVIILLYINETEDGKKYYVFDVEEVYDKNPNLKTKICKSSVDLKLLSYDIEKILLFLGFYKKE
ncbi:MAG: hypothetical protein J6A95_01740 [Clostridia bacterium]|nr:hypothetical protein [Clostridia bacterium]